MTTVGTFCTYCGVVADTVDHVVPQWLLKAAESNQLDLSAVFRVKRWIVPACRECNTGLSGKVFRTLKERRDAAHKHIRRRYASFLRMPDWSEEELSEMGDNARSDIVHSLRMRDFVRERLRWRGANEVEELAPVFDLATAYIRKVGA